MAKVHFNSQEDLDSHVSALMEAQLTDIRAQHAAEIASLTEQLSKLKDANVTADYSAFSQYPDLVKLLKATKLRPGSLPALCALHIWHGLTTAKAISSAIPVTPKMGDDEKIRTDGKEQRGGKPSNAKIITAALQKLEKSMFNANTGVGIKVKSIRGPDGDSEVKKIRFAPIVVSDFDEAAIDAESASDPDKIAA